MLLAVNGEDSHLWEVVPCFSETAQEVFGLVFAHMAPLGGFYACEATRKPPRSHCLSTGLTSPVPLGRGLGR